MPATVPSRRRFLQVALSASGAAALPPAGAQALKAEAFAVSTWHGPLSSFGLADTRGKTWSLGDFEGRAVLLNFWASWCEPCRAEMPSLQQAAERHGADRLLVLAINFKETPSRAAQFARAAGVKLPVLLDVKGQAARRWDVKIFPTTLAIDRHGVPRLRVQGEVDWTGKAAEKLIASLF